MKLKNKITFTILVVIQFLFFSKVSAFTLNSIAVQNHINQSIITISFDNVPSYKIFSLHNPERIVIDLLKISKVHKNLFPIEFNGNNLIKRIRTNSTASNFKNIRIVFDLQYASHIQTITQKKIGKNYSIILIFLKKSRSFFNSNNQHSYAMKTVHKNTCIPFFYFVNKNFQTKIQEKKINIQQHNQINNTKKIQQQFPIIIAIDAGHGGHDPGATGYRGIYEKHITFGIARKLKNLLDVDPKFKAVMIRDGDYFLSVMDRSDLARKKRANILISIHADSALNPKVRGASVWVLSNRRAKTEMMHWLKCREKHAELLGGLGDILTNYQNDDPYFNHLILDLQFGYAQKEGYNIAMQMLNQLKNVSFLHKSTPEYSNFGVLRSPDITSVLIETGFISNIQEGYLLTTHKYQERIARAIYQGLQSYFLTNQEKKL